MKYIDQYNRGMVSYLIHCVVALSLFFSCQGKEDNNPVEVSDRDGIVEIENGLIKARFTELENGVRQEFFSFKEGNWVMVVESFQPPIPFPQEGTQLFNSNLDPEHRFLVSELLKEAGIEYLNEDEAVVRLSGRMGEVPIEQYVKLERNKEHFHFEIAATLKGKPARLDYLLSTFAFNLERPPTFVHTPGLKYDNEDSGQNRFKLLPGRDQIIGDRAFHAPAIILQDKHLFTALVPDLHSINEFAIVSPDARRTIDIPINKFSVPMEEDKFTMPSGLDLNVQTGLTDKPVFTFGILDNIIAHHIHYQRVNDTSMVRTLNDSNIRYGFDLFVGANVLENRGFQKIPAHQWERFGQKVFKERPHLAMPFEEYFRIIDSVTFHPIPYEGIDAPLTGYADMGSWLQWEIDSLPVGGYRSSIPWWNDVLHNSLFWNNAREAAGFWFWGKDLDRSELTDRARRIINLCLSAPRNENGLFALLYSANSGKWGLHFSDPPHGKDQFFLRESSSYNIPAMSKTGAHMLDYYIRCEKDPRIIQYLKPYADWLLTAIDERGAVPSYVTTNMEFSPILKYSAHPAASMWFLGELYNSTGEEKYLKGSTLIANYLEKEVLPEAKWIDMEQYYSCGKKPLDFVRDTWQNQIARGNLSIFWACEGFAALYRGTNNERFLQSGEQCIDYVSFTQCCWEPHFIYTAFPFGGFGVDNSDNATMLDARQAEIVKSFIWYGKTLGRQDLLERGVAAARSSIVLINHPRHKSNNIYRHTNIYPFGLGPENIDHEAHPQSAMRTHPAWGEGSGVFTGLAEASRDLGGLYINTDKEIAVGVDGLRIDRVTFEEEQVIIEVDSWLSGKYLNEPWTSPYITKLILEGDIHRIVFNDNRFDIEDGLIDLEVLPGKYVRIVN